MKARCWLTQPVFCWQLRSPALLQRLYLLPRRVPVRVCEVHRIQRHHSFCTYINYNSLNWKIFFNYDKIFRLTLTTNRKNSMYLIIFFQISTFVIKIKKLSQSHFLARFHGDHFKVRLLANLSFNSQSLNLSKPLALYTCNNNVQQELGELSGKYKSFSF